MDQVFAGSALKKAPHLEELERKRELLRQVRVRRDASLVNRGAVKCPDTISCRWVNVNLERQLQFQFLGWRKVGADDVDIETAYKQPDGTHVRGDLILYCIDKEMADLIHLDDVCLGIERIEGHKESFETEAGRAGVPTFRPKIQ